MSYTITTTASTTSHDVTTLTQARDESYRLVYRHSRIPLPEAAIVALATIDDLSAAGGMIGPLPNGVIITVAEGVDGN
jgi:hypothetical protein